jgi:hypothetical protein
MGGWWWVFIVALGLVGWAYFLCARFDGDARLAASWTGRTRGLGGMTGPTSFLVSAAALAVFVLLMWVADGVADELGDPLWELLVTGPALLVYAPFVLATAPSQSSGYREWRRDLAEAGAAPREQRRIAWWAGLPSLGGVLAIGMALWSAFAG